jgi:hypothetical protein
LCSGYSVLQELTQASELKSEEKRLVGQLERDDSAGPGWHQEDRRGKIMGTLKRIRDFSYIDPHRTQITLH